MIPKKTSPIGVFDSGIGGLTVVKSIRRLLPHENIVYFGDTARVPYGTKSRQSVVKFSKQNADILLKHNVKMIVVACNTSSSWALKSLQSNLDVPVLGVINPGAKRAALVTKTKQVGVIATPSTISSGAYQKSIKKCDPSIKVKSKACPLFVPLAEEGWQNKSITIDVAKEYLKGFKQSKIDALILGCTHYPLLKNAVKKVVGKNITLIDSADEMAKSVKAVLNNQDLLTNKKSKGKLTCLVSDDPSHFSPLASKILKIPVLKARKVI